MKTRKRDTRGNLEDMYVKKLCRGASAVFHKH